MLSKLVVHDIDEPVARDIFSALPADSRVFAAKPACLPCMGCFGCWVRSPGQCVLRDRATPLPMLLADARELVLVSRCVYGGLSPEVKGAMDRSIGYVLPFFRLLDGEMHHTMRYGNGLRLHLHLYGDIAPEERPIAEALVQAMGRNFGCRESRVSFYETPQALAGRV